MSSSREELPELLDGVGLAEVEDGATHTSLMRAVDALSLAGLEICAWVPCSAFAALGGAIRVHI